MENNVKVLTLDSIPTLKQLIGGGGSDVNLLSNYTATVGSNDVYNASYVNGRLNSSTIAIGQFSSAQGTQSMAIGFDAQIVAGELGVALGTQSSCRNSFSVALGFNSETHRTKEVSIGAGNSSPYATRYLANVTAGELPTDAVNLAQVRGATVGDVLYASPDVASTITLATPVSQYEKVEIIGSWSMPYTETTTPLQVIGHWHLNDQDNSRTFQLRAVDLDPANNQKTEVVETWSFTGSTTLEMISGAVISGDLTGQTIETVDTPSIIITKVIGIKAL